MSTSRRPDSQHNRARLSYRALISHPLMMRLALIVIFALAFRAAVFMGRIANDPDYTNWTAPSDQAEYIKQARDLVHGDWPNGPFWFQPGNVVWLAIWIALTGDNLFAVQVITFAIGSLRPLLVYVAAKQLSGSTRTGLIAALLMALYPVAAFLDTTMLTAPPDGLFAAAYLAAIAQMIRNPKFGWAALTGVLFGLAAYFRATTFFVVPAGVLALLFVRARWPRRAALAAVMIAALALTLTPGAWWNTSQVGSFVLTSPSGPVNLYIGNNRDAMGVRSLTQALEAVDLADQDWMAATIRDVQAEPVRAAGLFIRKLGLAWSNTEVPNIVDYVHHGLDKAPVLYIIPINFRVLAFLGVMGGLLALRRGEGHRPDPTVIGLLAAAGFSVGLAVVYIVSRYRMPMFPALCIPAAYGIGQIIARRESLRSMLTAAGGAALILALLALGRETLPLPRFHSAVDLPADFTPSDLRFGDDLRLLGYRLDQPDVQSGGPMLVTLLWQADHPPARDYSVFLKLVMPDGQEVGQGDVQIGTVSYPNRPLTTWRDGAVFEETVLVRPDEPGAPLLWIGVYDKADLTRLAVSDSAGGVYADDAAVLGPVRIIDPGAARLVVPDRLLRARFGEGIQLIGFSLSTNDPQPGDTITLTLVWEVDATPAVEANVFVHVLGPDGVIAQSDGPPIDGLMPTSLWRPGDVWEDTHTFILPADLTPGSYVLRIGLYDWSNGVRLPISDAGFNDSRDNSLMLGLLVLEGE
jgi:4-amino-4-deoxy-L-arabinose transferase-like glycosyltransferase